MDFSPNSQPQKTRPRYEIQGILGKGAMGEVFLARKGESLVALKFLKPSLDSKMRQYFKGEVRLLSRLSHPNLLKIYNFYESGASFSTTPGNEGLLKLISEDMPFFSMEYCPGHDLDHPSIENSPKRWTDTLAQICHGLHYLHSRHILHRDIKPSNVLLREDGKVKILDFSLSLNTQELMSQTQRGGTLPFLAPETFSGSYDPRSDLFALGVLMYRITSGTLPFDKALIPSQLNTVAALTPLGEKRPDLPDFFCSIVDRMLNFNPEKRPNSALTVLRYLKDHSKESMVILDEEETSSIMEKIPLVGRKRELDALRKAADVEGFHLITLKGPTGVGRTRLMEELKWNLLLDRNIPFFTFRASTADWLKELIFLVSELSFEGMGDDLESLSKTLLRALASRRIYLVLNDFHLWPENFRPELEFVVDSLRQANAKLTLILEFNSDFLSHWTEKKQLRLTAPLEVKDFSEEESRSLLEQASIGSPLPLSVIQEISRASGGRPLLLLESLQHALRQKYGGGFQAPASTFPKNLQDAMHNRLSRLRSPARILLGLILCAEEAPSLKALEDAWEGSPEELEDANLELDQENFLVPREAKIFTAALAHSSLKGTLENLLNQKTKQEAHRLWAKYWESDQAADTPKIKREYLLAHHGLKAEDKHLVSKYGMAGLQYLYQQEQLEPAIEFSKKIIDCIPSPQEHCKLFAYQAPIFYSLGRYSEALEAYERWYSLREDDESQLQRTKYYFYRGLCFNAWGKIAEASENFELCLNTSDPKKFPAIRTYLSRAKNHLAAIEEKIENWACARELLQASLEFGLGDHFLIGEAEHRIGKIDLKLLNFDSAQVHFENCLANYEGTQDEKAVAIAHNLLGLLFKSQGFLAKAKKAFQASTERISKKSSLKQWARNQGNWGLVCCEQGDYSQALDSAKSASEILEFLGGEEDQLVSHFQLASVFLQIGNFDRTNHLLADLRLRKEELEGLQLWKSLLLLLAEGAYLADDLDRAEQIFLSCENIGTKDWDIEKFQAALGVFRTKARRGSVAKDQNFINLLDILSRTTGPYFSAWHELLLFLSMDPEGLTQSDYRGLLESIRVLENPDLQIEMLDLLAIYLGRNRMSALFEEIDLKRNEIWNNLHLSLPEEIKMDFEKNRSLRDLDKAIADPIENKKKLPIRETSSPSASSTVPPSAHSNVAMIPETKFKQFCEIALQISQKGSLDEILQRVMDATIELSHAERGFVILKKDPEGGEESENLEVKTARHINKRALKQDEFQFSHTLVRQALIEGGPVLSENALEDSRFAEMKSVHALQLKSILVIPLEIEGIVLGAIYLDNRLRLNCFSPEDISVIAGFAGQAALAIQRGMILEELKQAKEKLEKKVQDQAERLESLSEELSHSRKDLKLEYPEIIGKSPAMMRVFQLLDHVTQTRIPVWIWGESGTGKELIARALHYNSTRRQGPFVSENCSSIPETLIESELFGHKKGAFTHADRDRIGLFEQANGGTLFLDEIADMSLNMQAKLLRVLQEGEIRPVGSNKKVKIDVRLVTASHRDIERMVSEGKFREDLFYRLNGMTIALPPLRERKEDIPLLVHFLVQKICKEFDLKPAEMSQEVIQYLMEQNWPGNIRQMESVVRNLLLFSHGKTITKQILEMQIRFLEKPKSSWSSNAPVREDLSSGIEDEDEKKKLIESLVRHNLDKAKVADEFSITLKSVYARMERLGIPTKKSLLVKFLDSESMH